MADSDSSAVIWQAGHWNLPHWLYPRACGFQYVFTYNPGITSLNRGALLGSLLTDQQCSCVPFGNVYKYLCNCFFGAAYITIFISPDGFKTITDLFMWSLCVFNVWYELVRKIMTGHDWTSVKPKKYLMWCYLLFIVNRDVQGSQ